MKKLVFILAATVALASCSHDEVDNYVAPIPEGDDVQLMVTASMDESQTRIASDDGLTFSFVENDAIGLYLHNNYMSSSALQNVKFNAGEPVDGFVDFTKDESEIWNTAAILKQEGTTILAYAPYTDTEIKVEGSTESGKDEVSQLSATIEGASRIFSLPAQQSGSVEDVVKNYVLAAVPTAPKQVGASTYKVDLRFSGIYSLAKFRLVNTTANSISISKVHIEGAEGVALTGLFTADLNANPKFANEYYALTAVEGKTNNYIDIVPATAYELAAGAEVVFYAVVNTASVAEPVMTVEGTSGDCTYVYTETKTGKTANFIRAKRNGISMDLTAENGTLTQSNISAGGKYYASLNEAIASGAAEIQLEAGSEYTLSTSGNNVKIVGTTPLTPASEGVDESTAPAKAKVTLTGGDLRFKSITLENLHFVSPDKGDDYTSSISSTEGTTAYNNCDIENVYFCTGTNNEFNGCTFLGGGKYNVWTYGSNATFNDCVFYSKGRCVLVYAHGGGADKWAKANFTDCKFYASETVKDKAAVEIDSSNCSFEVNIKDCTAEGFGNENVSKNSLYNLKNGTLGIKGAEGVNCTITVNGKQLIADGLVLDVASNVYEISNANGLVAANDMLFPNAGDGHYYKLTANIDMSSVNNWESKMPQNNNINCTFDGGEYAINSWKGTTQKALLFPHFRPGSNVTVKNLSLNSCSIDYDPDSNGEDGVGLLVGYSELQVDGSSLTIEGCQISDCTIDTSANWAGAYVGGFVNAATLTIKDCKTLNSTVRAGGSVGGIIGYDAGISTISGCTVTGNTLTSADTGDWRVGTVAGTKGNAGVYSNNTADASQNTYTQDDTAGHSKATYTYGDNAVCNYAFGRYTNAGDFYVEGKKVTLGNAYDPTTGDYYAFGKSGLATAINAGATKINLANGEYDFAAPGGGDLHIVGASTDAIINIPQTYSVGSTNITFDNITLDVVRSTNYIGFQHSGAVTYNKCVIKGGHFNCYTPYSDADGNLVYTTFNECEFVQDVYDYHLWTYPSNVKFEKCTFNCVGKAVKVYAEVTNSPRYQIILNECKFINTGEAKKAAVEIDATYTSYDVYINGCTEEGFAVGEFTTSTLYNLEGSNGRVFIDNVQVSDTQE